MCQNTYNMQTLKRLGLSIAILTLGLSVFIGVSLWSTQRYFGTSDHLKQWLRESGMYPAIQREIITQTAKAATDSQEQQGVTLSQPIVQKALGKAVTEQYIQESAEEVITGTYAWLDGTTEKPVYRIDVEPVKTAFADSILGSAKSRLNDLPPCVLPDQATTTDPFTTNCSPPPSVSKAELARLRKEIITSQDFLPQDITADTYTLDPAAQSKPVNTNVAWYENVQSLPVIFQWTQRGPLIFLVLGLVSVAGVIFLSRTRRTGMKRAATTVLSSSAALALSSIALLFTVRYIKTPGPDQDSALYEPMLALFKLASTAVSRWQLITCVVLAVLSGAALLALRFTDQTPPAVKPRPLPAKR